MPTLHAFCQAAAERVRDVTGYDRVMVYRFMEDGSGWVFAEARDDRLQPFLDLHYPASDIPKQARALYLRNWLRLITRVDYEPSPLIPPVNPLTSLPLDMSQATLRDVSPIHREYLRNMGVDASMSISIIREGKLWGLIACHHYTPRVLPRHLRAVCELFGAMFSLQLDARERAELFEARIGSRKVLQTLMQNLAEFDDYEKGLVHNSPNLLDYIQAGGLALRSSSQGGGVAVRINNGISTVGVTPNEDQISALTEWLGYRLEESGEGLFLTDRLGELWPAAKEFADVGSGLLAISVSREPRDFILWFRPEEVETVKWGGDPDKPVEVGPNGARLTPRKSFEVWTQTVCGRASPWSAADNDAAFDLRIALLEVVLRRIEAANRERERAHEQEKLLMMELDHRVKNTLANISALVTQTSRSATTLSDFANGLTRRIQSMAKAHSLLTQSRWEGVSLMALMREEVDHYGSGSAAPVLEGPDVVLSPKAALSLSLAIHELVTNAAKYGALSVHDGRLFVRWHMNPDGGVDLQWRELGGPPVQAPKRRGFGTKLIERALRVETGGSTALRFEPGGVECDINLPAQSIVQVSDVPAASLPFEGQPGTRPSPHAKCRILVVEDSSLVIMTLEHLLEDLGWEMVGPATRVGHALELAETAQVDAALLDVNLDGELSWDVVRLLRRKGVPCILTTGYDSSTALPHDLADLVIVGKPFRPEDIESELRSALAR